MSTNKLECIFSIRRVFKTSDTEYIKALRIYNDTTPYEIKTPPSEITLWLDKQTEQTKFDMSIFILYLNNIVIGMAMTTYVKSSKIVIDEYLAVENQYRSQTLFLAYENLIFNYYKENSIDISYYITEINDGDKFEMDRESAISLKLLCVNNFGKINMPFYGIPLNLSNYESDFEVALYVKGVDNTYSINSKTYYNIVKSIYYDYWLEWYSQLLENDQFNEYQKCIANNMNKIEKNIKNDTISIVYSECATNNSNTTTSYGTFPTQNKRSSPFWIIIPIALVIITLIIIVYNSILVRLNIPFSSVSTVIGSTIGASVTAVTSLYISNKNKN